MQGNKGKGFSEGNVYLGKYRTMLKNKARFYFDVGEFEGIINYFLENGKISEAENALNFALKLHPDSVILQLKNAHILIEKSKIDEAFKLLTKLKSIQSNEPEIYFLLGYVEVLKKNTENANDYFSDFLKAGILNDDTLSSIAFVYEQQGYYTEALKYLQKAIKINPKNKYVLYDIAFCYEQISNLEKSAKYYGKYLEENPHSANAWYNLGVINNLAKKYNEAVEAYDFAIAVKPDFASAYFNKASILNNSGKTEEAISVYKDFLKIEKNNVPALTRTAECCMRLERYEDAKLYFKKALKIDNNYPDALYGKALSAYFTDEYLEGLNLIMRAIKIDNKNVDYNFLKAQLFTQLGYIDKADESYINTLKLDFSSEKIWLAYSDLYIDTDIKKANDILKFAQKALPENLSVIYTVALNHIVEGNYSEACNHLDQVFKEDVNYISQLKSDCPNCNESPEIKLLIEKY